MNDQETRMKAAKARARRRSIQNFAEGVGCILATIVAVAVVLGAAGGLIFGVVRLVRIAWSGS